MDRPTLGVRDSDSRRISSCAFASTGLPWRRRHAQRLCRPSSTPRGPPFQPDRTRNGNGEDDGANAHVLPAAISQRLAQLLGCEAKMLALPPSGSLRGMVRLVICAKSRAPECSPLPALTNPLIGLFSGRSPIPRVSAGIRRPTRRRQRRAARRRGPGTSSVWMRPCRFHPVPRSQVRGQTSVHGSGSSSQSNSASLQPSKCWADE